MIALKGIFLFIALPILLICVASFLIGFFAEFPNIMDLPNRLESKGKSLAKKIKTKGGV